MNEAECQNTDFFLFTGILIVLVIVLGAMSLSLIFTKKSETFSQVFLAQETIPSQVIAGENLQFSFFVENNEGTQSSYSYEIWAEGSKKKSGEIVLENAERKKIDESISFSNAFSEKQKVLVKVFSKDSSQPYTLWFWVNVS
ncbi:MAG: DUF1616 domain-containing protein [archaeon]|nr:DUF1616 domain-containing protein [archaeon]